MSNTNEQQPEALRLADRITPIGQFTNLIEIYKAANELRRLHAENEALKAQVQAAPAAQPDAQLCKFYGVTTAAELIAAQAAHIEKLQAKLPASPTLAPTKARES